MKTFIIHVKGILILFVSIFIFYNRYVSAFKSRGSERQGDSIQGVHLLARAGTIGLHLKIFFQPFQN